jgi:hypothetical protein
LFGEVMPKRPTRKAGAEATDKLAGEKKDPPAAAKQDEAPVAEAEPRPASGAAKPGRAEKKAEAPPLKDPEPAKPATGRGKKKDAAGMDEVSEERSGDQPVQDDDATTAPVPDRVRARRFTRDLLSADTTRTRGKPKFERRTDDASVCLVVGVAFFSLVSARSSRFPAPPGVRTTRTARADRRASSLFLPRAPGASRWVPRVQG